MRHALHIKTPHNDCYSIKQTKVLHNHHTSSRDIYNSVHDVDKCAIDWVTVLAWESQQIESNVPSVWWMKKWSQQVIFLVEVSALFASTLLVRQQKGLTIKYLSYLSRNSYLPKAAQEENQRWQLTTVIWKVAKGRSR